MSNYLDIINAALVSVDELPVTDVTDTSPSIIYQIKQYIKEGMSAVISALPKHPCFTKTLAITPTSGWQIDLEGYAEAVKVFSIIHSSNGMPLTYYPLSRYEIQLPDNTTSWVLVQATIGTPTLSANTDVLPFDSDLEQALNLYVTWKAKQFLGHSDATQIYQLFQNKIAEIQRMSVKPFNMRPARPLTPPSSGIVASGSGAGSPFTPSLDFSVPSNSQFVALLFGW